MTITISVKPVESLGRAVQTIALLTSSGTAAQLIAADGLRKITEQRLSYEEFLGLFFEAICLGK